MGREHQTFGTWVVVVPNRAFPASFRRGLAHASKSVEAQCSRRHVECGNDSLTYCDRKKLYDLELSSLRVYKEEEGAARLEEDEAAADAEGYGFGAGGGSEFAEDGGYVKFGGVVGYVQAGGDFLVGETGG